MVSAVKENIQRPMRPEQHPLRCGDINNSFLYPGANQGPSAPPLQIGRNSPDAIFLQEYGQLLCLFFLLNRHKEHFNITGCAYSTCPAQHASSMMELYDP